MDGVAVKVTDWPLQTGPEGLAAMMTAGVTGAVTTISVPLSVPVTAGVELITRMR